MSQGLESPDPSIIPLCVSTMTTSYTVIHCLLYSVLPMRTGVVALCPFFDEVLELSAAHSRGKVEKSCITRKKALHLPFSLQKIMTCSLRKHFLLPCSLTSSLLYSLMTWPGYWLFINWPHVGTDFLWTQPTHNFKLYLPLFSKPSTVFHIPRQWMYHIQKVSGMMLNFAGTLNEGSSRVS